MTRLQGDCAMNLYVEIRAGEGGDDAKDLVRLQAGLYGKMAVRNCL